MSIRNFTLLPFRQINGLQPQEFIVSELLDINKGNHGNEQNEDVLREEVRTIVSPGMDS